MNRYLVEAHLSAQGNVTSGTITIVIEAESAPLASAQAKALLESGNLKTGAWRTFDVE